MDTLSDEAIVERVRAGETALFELLMRRYNQRAFRTVRSFLRTDAESEDALQQAWVQAYAHLHQFHGTARFSTWLLRIAVNEARMRLRREGRQLAVAVGDVGFAEPELEVSEMPVRTPEEMVQSRELAGVLEQVIDALPEGYRSVFMLREVEGLSTIEAAEILGVSEEVIKTRLHRARGMLREGLLARAGENIHEAFGFMGARCDRMVERVLAAIGAPTTH